MDPKHITRTSFCNKEIDNVTDNSMKKYILDNLKIKTNLDKLISIMMDNDLEIELNSK